jgi:hypothetical protein
MSMRVSDGEEPSGKAMAILATMVGADIVAHRQRP